MEQLQLLLCFILHLHTNQDLVHGTVLSMHTFADHSVADTPFESEPADLMC